MNMGMERWGFLFSVVSSSIVYFLKTTRAVCPNINPRTFVTSTIWRVIVRGVSRKFMLSILDS